MAKHNVYLKIPSKELSGADARIFIYKNDKKLGEILVSKGGLDYYPARRKLAIPISWTDFDALMKQHEKEKG